MGQQSRVLADLAFGTQNVVAKFEDQLSVLIYRRAIREAGGMKQVPECGSRIVRTLYGRNLESCIRHHHERFDGQGHPDGLKGDKIPIEARIILLADTFDAMTSNRPYQRALSTEQSMDEMRKCAGKQFDPELVNLIVDCGDALEDARSGQAQPSKSLADLACAV